MRLVIIESPYSGDVRRNKAYLRACILDCLRRGESPYASHQMLTEALNDCVASERKMGIEAGFFWRHKADATVVYDDLSVSRGMRAGIEHAHQIGCPVEWRKLGGKWS